MITWDDESKSYKYPAARFAGDWTKQQLIDAYYGRLIAPDKTSFMVRMYFQSVREAKWTIDPKHLEAFINRLE